MGLDFELKKGRRKIKVGEILIFLRDRQKIKNLSRNKKRDRKLIKGVVIKKMRVGLKIVIVIKVGVIKKKCCRGFKKWGYIF